MKVDSQASNTIKKSYCNSFLTDTMTILWFTMYFCYYRDVFPHIVDYWNTGTAQ